MRTFYIKRFHRKGNCMKLVDGATMCFRKIRMGIYTFMIIEQHDQYFYDSSPQEKERKCVCVCVCVR